MTRRLLSTLAALALAGAVALALAGLWFRFRIDDASLPRAETVVVIPNGATGRDVARLLADDGIVSSAFAFDLLARFEGRRSSMKAGEFRFGAHRPMTAILQQVVAGGRQVAIW
ncbi:MAG: endolytic transglycosylase MltG, partial [Candidatus Eremiobacteraeota bacterium]|nr:endolytic transglycosylase MltG [Candidatus Eremiobacteraeota bacterium]